MDDKLKIIQLLIDTESPSVLNKVKMMLLEKSPLEGDDQYEVPEAIRAEIEKKSQDHVAGKIKWKSWKEVKNILARKYGQ
ncbi:MAG: hypothetical protein PSV16_11530 [Flavobacterium sp.]|nr:hypothetical protein [Flavobacterium sp.]